MMRRLIIMRHAKSSWSSDATSDHDRPLNHRGRRDAPKVADRLAELDWLPQAILSSDSRRTRETCQLMQRAWRTAPAVHYLRSLYHGGIESLRNELPVVADDVQTLLVLGHNPGWEEVVGELCGQQVPMKTGTAALLEGDAACWSDAFRTPWTLCQLIYPREL